MRSYVPSYQLISTANLHEALSLLDAEPGVWHPFAGGTDLMVLFEAGTLPHKKYLNIWNLTELRGIEATENSISIGALTTYTEIQSNSTLQTEFPMLCQAASETGGVAIQNRGTLGGNIVNASPAADSPPALLAYDAVIELTSVDGSRRVPYKDFHTSYKQMNRRSNELLTRIYLVRPSKELKHYYRKVGTRRAQAIAKVCFAGVATINSKHVDDVRIALGSVAPIPLRCVQTETVLRGNVLDAALVQSATNALATEITPITDIRSNRDYRLRVSQNLLKDFLMGLACELI